MADDIDFNDVIEDIFLSENTLCQDSYKEGFRVGSEEGNPEGYHLGYHRGAEIGRELGYYLGIVTNYLEQNKSNEKQEDRLADKTVKQLEKVKGLIETFPRNNSENHDILALLEAIRAQYKKVLMETSITKVHQHLDRILKYLNPLLPLANCHMVEFFTENHWEKLLPKNLIQTIDKWDLNYAVEKFWTYASEPKNNNNCELRKWIHKAQNHSLLVNNDFCISVEELEQHLECWGGSVLPEIRISEFMTSKKSYEVQRMSRLVASLYNATSSTHCMEAGGGRGHLLVALTLGYNIPSLTVDCDDKALKNAADRVRIIQKQWRAIAKKITNGNEELFIDNKQCNIHRFATSFITNKTNVAKIMKESFPEHYENDYKILLTGLHTCGNLGPDSLRIFSSQTSTTGLFNVPCCYHLLTEKVDADLFDVFQRDYGCGTSEYGFPMSEYLRDIKKTWLLSRVGCVQTFKRLACKLGHCQIPRLYISSGYNLGRNARMLAAQSLDRVLHNRQLPDKSLLYRALFQIIVKTHLPKSNLKDGKLKKVASKCDNFTQYFKMADKLLSLGLYDRLPDSYLTDVSNDLHCQWKQIVMFNLLRLCLAQVIESVVLLDRLLYLLENGYRKSYIVKLFDPVMSPRCHSIVAVR